MQTSVAIRAEGLSPTIPDGRSSPTEQPGDIVGIPLKFSFDNLTRVIVYRDMFRWCQQLLERGVSDSHGPTFP